jgi:hypothetical protein
MGVCKEIELEVFYDFLVSICVVNRVNPLRLDVKLRVFKDVTVNVMENVIRQFISV